MYREVLSKKSDNHFFCNISVEDYSQQLFISETTKKIMDYASTKSYGDSTSHACDYCGAEIEVLVTKQTGHNEKEDYYCPECNKRFYKRASLPIMNVNLIKPRTDGKTDKYQNPPEED
jgi:uncharacterized protein with PIN domain